MVEAEEHFSSWFTDLWNAVWMKCIVSS